MEKLNKALFVAGRFAFGCLECLKSAAEPFNLPKIWLENDQKNDAFLGVTNSPTSKYFKISRNIWEASFVSKPFGGEKKSCLTKDLDAMDSGFKTKIHGLRKHKTNTSHSKDSTVDLNVKTHELVQNVVLFRTAHLNPMGNTNTFDSGFSCTWTEVDSSSFNIGATPNKTTCRMDVITLAMESIGDEKWPCLSIFPSAGG